MSEDPTSYFKPLIAASWLLIAVIAGSLLVFGREVLVPLAIAFLLWHLINALASYYTHTAQFLTPFHFILPQGLALVAGAATVIGLIVVVAQLVADNVQQMAVNAPVLRDALRERLPSLAADIGLQLPANLEDMLARVGFGQLLAQTATALTSVAGSAGLIAIYVLFLLLEQRGFERKLDHLFAEPVSAARTRNVLEQIERRIETYLRIKTFMSLLTGGSSYVVLAIFGVDFAGFWALWIFLLNYIPNIGSIVGVLFPTLLTLVQFDDLLVTLSVGAILTSLQFAIGNLLEPRLMGHSLNLSPFVIIVSLALWGSIWGIAGLFLCVPLTMIVAIVCAQLPATRPVAVLLSADGRVD